MGVLNGLFNEPFKQTVGPVTVCAEHSPRQNRPQLNGMVLDRRGMGR